MQKVLVAGPVQPCNRQFVDSPLQPSLALELADWTDLTWKEISVETRLVEWKRHLTELDLSFDFFQDQLILDVGCGPTGIIYFLNPKAGFGLDPLAHEYERWNGHWGRKVQLIPGCGEDMPFRSDSIDTVFCVNCIDHTANPAAVLAEIARVLKPGGLLVFHVDLDSPLRKLHKRIRKRCSMQHPHSLTYEWLSKTLERNFEIVKVHRDPSVFKPTWRQMRYEAYWDGLIYRVTRWSVFMNHVWLKAQKPRR